MGLSGRFLERKWFGGLVYTQLGTNPLVPFSVAVGKWTWTEPRIGPYTPEVLSYLIRLRPARVGQGFNPPLQTNGTNREITSTFSSSR